MVYLFQFYMKPGKIPSHNNSSDDGKSADEGPSSDEFASSDESFD